MNLHTIPRSGLTLELCGAAPLIAPQCHLLAKQLCAIFQLTGLFHLQLFLRKEMAYLSNTETLFHADLSYGKY